MIAAVRADKPADYAKRFLATLGLAFPDFWLGTVLVRCLGLWLHYNPALGFVSLLVNPWANLQQIYLPALALGAAFAASSMRMRGSQLLEALR